MASSSSPAWRLISSPVPTVPSVAMTELEVTEGTVVRITERVPLPRGRDWSLSTAADITKQGLWRPQTSAATDQQGRSSPPQPLGPSP